MVNNDYNYRTEIEFEYINPIHFNLEMAHH